MIELHNLKTKKLRLVTLMKGENVTFMNIFNLVSCFHSYTESFGDSDNGPVFISNWVRTYIEHKGVMTFTPEILSRKNLEYLTKFGFKNAAIKGLVFGDSLLF